ncbi:hypothetical protein ACKWTF_000237 [Chironomus riparius]
MFISRRFLMTALKSRQNIFTVVYVSVILFFLYYRFVLNEYKVTSLTLKKYIMRHHDASVIQHMNEEQLQVKNILFWTKFWNKTSWYLGSDEAGKELLESLNCPVTNCFFTHNRTYLSNVTQYDAILFHGAQYLKDQPPNERASDQLYVFANLESPYLTVENLTRYKNFYNLTMTYRFDSDIPWFYGRIVEKSTSEIIAPSMNPTWKEPESNFYDPEMHKIVLRKKTAMAWFASNCKSASKREDLVNKLQKFIDVDIYGKCGKLHCEKNSMLCYDMLTANYSFYLSFENSICRDYITEKLYRPLTEYIIPIVFNSGKMSLYAPPNSYIDANDFDSIEHLVAHLKFLMSNPKEYVKYFWWKKYYDVVIDPASFKIGFCDLCMKLNNPEFMEQKHMYPDIHSWWVDGMC